MIATHFEKIDALSAALKESLQQRFKREPTTLLIKGSRFMRMERVVKDLVEEIH
jgi:UDP-N-acetylmuramyl pentapeptide synthase